MPSTVPYSLALVGLVLAASLSVLGADDICFSEQTCQTCVGTKTNTTGSGNGTCVWEVTSSGQKCVTTYTPSQEITTVAFNIKGCEGIPSTTTPPPSTTTPTTVPPTTNGTTTTPTTTTAPPTTNGTTTTTPTTTSTAAPTTNGTTTPTTPTPSTNGTTTIPTTPGPSNGTTTAAPKPTPAPTKGGFSWASFIGGIVFAAALSSLGYIIWRFYKVRLDRNYHTFSNPTF